MARGESRSTSSWTRDVELTESRLVPQHTTTRQDTSTTISWSDSSSSRCLSLAPSYPSTRSLATSSRICFKEVVNNNSSNTNAREATNPRCGQHRRTLASAFSIFINTHISEREINSFSPLQSVPLPKYACLCGESYPMPMS